MFGRRIYKMSESTKIVNSILHMEDQSQIHPQLDNMVNSVRIFYKSREDFERNYPAPNDLTGKVNLIITRRD
jgi:hypothetical protein